MNSDLDGEDKKLEAEERFDKIYIALKEFDGFVQGGVPASFKSKLLQTLYMFADDDRPRLLLLIARLVLAVSFFKRISKIKLFFCS